MKPTADAKPQPSSRPARDRFRIDSHKVQWHPSRVARWHEAGSDWEKAKKVYPIYVEISPSGACNHRCTFCAVDYIGYKTRFLDAALLKERLSEMGRLGVRSVMFAGEGEPLLHKDIGEITRHAKASGLDAAFTTNAVALTDKFIESTLHAVQWIKASVNAGDPETYHRVHRTRGEDFDKAMGNMGRAAKFRQANRIGTALGAQMVLLPENARSAVSLARRAKEEGLDYVVIKPYSQHKFSLTHAYEGMDYDETARMVDDLDALSDENFQVVFRRRTMEKLKEDERYYTQCQATPFFWAYVMADGSVYSCSAYLEDDRFNLGDLNERTFQEIWEGEKRRENFHFVLDQLDISECRVNCRMDEVNRHLWDLKHPPEHVNFI